MMLITKETIAKVTDAANTQMNDSYSDPEDAHNQRYDSYNDRGFIYSETRSLQSPRG
ncbi:hypothetical protein DPMN_048265 [Dreissena polymorpha]|uniref:Uncharacterized protein n=1 Tax=Dreissena polymorpha TaxID=45954 RepID=A0A9D4DAH0_DREPO|nr:hypothetical protein DPMN_048265 [Dreissena polymorpha]